MGSATRPPTCMKISAAQGDASGPKKGESLPKTAAGFLLMDSSLHPVSFNTEAIEILSYPDRLANPTNSEVLLAAKIRSNLVSQQAPGESPFVRKVRPEAAQSTWRAEMKQSL